MPTPDGKRLYLSRTKYAGNTEGYTETGDIWFSTSTDDGQSWAPPLRYDALNTPQNNAVMAVMRDGEALLVRGSYGGRDGFRDEGCVAGGAGGQGPQRPARAVGYPRLPLGQRLEHLLYDAR